MLSNYTNEVDKKIQVEFIFANDFKFQAFILVKANKVQNITESVN